MDESYNSLSSTNILDLGTMKWSRGGDMNQARESHQMVALEGDRVLVLGGYNMDDGTLSTIEELSLENWTWSMMDVKMREARSFFSAVVVPEKMVSL